MTDRVPEPVYIILCQEDEGGQIAVDVEAFVRYAAELDASLAELEAKWRHLAPPARMPRRGQSWQEPFGV